MSLASWKEEFYPVGAKKVSKSQAVAHSLKKWIGLLSKNLKKHEVAVRDAGDLHDSRGNGLSISDRTCALCTHYIELGCTGCPLYEVRGQVKCSDEGLDEELDPFYMFCGSNHDPRPMIRWLRKALKWKPKKVKT